MLERQLNLFHNMYSKEADDILNKFLFCKQKGISFVVKYYIRKSGFMSARLLKTSVVT